ncbi:MAG: S-layer homology domain-containing protein [Bacillota bacterium]
MKKRLLAVLLSLSLLMTMFPAAALAAESENWDVSKSKRCTNWAEPTADITLSLPSAEEELVSDVVFVLDKSTSAALEDQAIQMLKDLKDQIDGNKAKVKVGIVIFNKEANVVFPLEELNNSNMDKIATAIRSEIKSGTNTHAGLLAGKAMLDADTAVDANRKHLIFVSDGITYMFNAEPTAVAWTFMADSPTNFASPDNWKSKYGSNSAPENWDTWMADIGALIETDGNQYDYPYQGTITNATPVEEADRHAMSIDKALYLTNQVYKEAEKAGYNCYTMTAGSNADYPWASSFMQYLAGGKTVSFDSIKKDILYAVDAGSKVTDVIGNNFDLIPDTFKITVGGAELPSAKLEGVENTWIFGENANAQSYRFKVTYLPEQEATEETEAVQEQFIWDINEAVSNFAPVQLSYQIKLVNKESAPGTYTVPTNESAILDAVSTDGIEQSSPFEKPTVEYTVNSHKPSSTYYTLDYVSNGGTEYKDEDYKKGTVVDLSKKPLREGYSFTGWYTDADLTEKITQVTMNSDKTVYAGWKKTYVPQWLNGEDHFAYIVGYPVDYRTDKPTSDKTLWPVRPGANITRAEVATIFFRLLNDDVRSANFTSDNEFKDLNSSLWCNNPISTMAALGIVKGRTTDTFAFNEPITRAEFAAICSRFDTSQTAAENTFTDLSGHWAKKDIEHAAALGWIMGYEDGTFRPNQYITRAEAMTMINRVLCRMPETPDDLLNSMNIWPDNTDTEKWYYLAVQEATNSHDYEAKDQTYERWTKMKADPDWLQYEKDQ